MGLCFSCAQIGRSQAKTSAMDGAHMAKATATSGNNLTSTAPASARGAKELGRALKLTVKAENGR